MSTQKLKNESPIEEQSYSSDSSKDSWVQSRVQAPEGLLDEWGQSYGDYVRVSVWDSDNKPVVAFAPMQNSSGGRANDFMLPSKGRLPLPHWLVRAFGAKDGLQWLEVGEQLVGGFKTYHDGRVLFAVADHYLPNYKETPYMNDEEPGAERYTTFANLIDVADKFERLTDTQPYTITHEHGRYVHRVPDSFAAGVTEGQDYAFILFHDGESFVIGLIPYDSDKDYRGGPEEKEMVFKHQYNPMSASPDFDESPADELPTVVLSYDEIKLHLRQNEDGETYYTVPKQIASIMWFSDGMTTDWIEIGDAFFARLVPESTDQMEERVSPNTIPTSFPWE